MATHRYELSSLNRHRSTGPSIDHIMTIAPTDSGFGGMPVSASPQAIVMARLGLAGDLAIPDGASMLALFVHPTAAGRDHSGHRFLADVLRANGAATLSIGLRSAEEEARRAPIAGGPEVAQRLQEVLDWLGARVATRRLPVVLVGVNEAAAPCALAARQAGLEAICSLVLLDGRVDLCDAEVAAWRRPTLCIAGRHGITLSGQPLAGARSLPSPHRLVKLRTQTQPRASAGAYQAMACQLAAWLRQQHCLLPREPASAVLTPLASAQ